MSTDSTATVTVDLKALMDAHNSALEALAAAGHTPASARAFLRGEAKASTAAAPGESKTEKFLSLLAIPRTRSEVRAAMPEAGEMYVATLFYNHKKSGKIVALAKGKYVTAESYAKMSAADIAAHSVALPVVRSTKPKASTSATGDARDAAPVDDFGADEPELTPVEKFRSERAETPDADVATPPPVEPAADAPAAARPTAKAPARKPTVKPTVKTFGG